jgi:hypothetical protein
MGRPIKSKFFGNRNRGGDNENTGGTGQGQTSGVGGESVKLVTFSNSGTLYSQGTTVSFGQPNIAGGIRATGTPVIDANGLLRGVTITEAGTGYTSAPTLTVTTASSVFSTTNSGNRYVNTFTVATATGIYLGMGITGGSTGVGGVVLAVTGTVITSSVSNSGTWTNAANLAFTDNGVSQANSVTLFANTTTQDSLAITSYLTTGSSAISGGDIIKQESSRRYLVRNAQGIGQVKLSAGTGTNHILSPGNMHLIATDNGGATYYVMKLTAHKAFVVNRTNTSTAIISTSTVVIGGVTYTGGDCGWTLGSITSATTQVSLAKNA